MKYTGRTAARRLLTLASSATLMLALWPSSAVRPRASAAGGRAASTTRDAIAETPARLLFTSDRDGNAEVYVRETAAGPEINLTKNPARDGNPAWSPDGTRVAFTSDRSGRPNIYVMNADGSNVRKITRNDEGVDVRVYDPAWSPDGTRLAYVSSFMGELSSLVVTNSDGTGGPQLLGSFSEVADPAWSPDGTRIAVAARTANSSPPGGVAPLVRYDIFVLNADGSGQTRVADRAAPFQSFAYPAEGSGPAWSPDGSRLAFASLRDGRAELFTCTATGGDLRRATDEALARETQPAWLAGAPADARLAFASDRSGRREIYAVDLRTGETTRLTEGAGNNSDPDWQIANPPARAPRPGRIVFDNHSDPLNHRSNRDVHSIDPEGTNFVALTNTPDRQEYAPSWSPDGTRIAFLGVDFARSLFVMDSDGGNVRNLGHSADPARRPSWSPDGTRISFIGGSDLAYTIEVINPDGTNRRRLHPFDNPYSQVAWSPDGRRVAFVRDARAGFHDPQIFIFNLEDGTERKLSVGDNRERNPAWSPDGTRIAFTRVENDPAASGGPIYIVNADGAPAPVAPAIEGVSFARHVDWSPDGAELAFAGTGAQGHGLYRVAAAGGAPTLVHKPAGQSQIDSVDWGAAAQPTVQWRAESFRLLEGGGGDALVVTRLGDLSLPATVSFRTRDACGGQAPAACAGVASARADYARAAGTLNFAPGEAAKTISVSLIDDGHAEGDETFEIVLSEPARVGLGAQSVVSVTVGDNDSAPASANPIDSARFFVRMHYLDFLGREPEPSGLEAWVRVWEQCPNLDNNPNCDLVTISSGFFRSREFHVRGLFVYNFYRAALGRPVTYEEFTADLARITGGTAAELELSRTVYAQKFTERDDFRALYGGVFGGTAFVDKVLQTAGVQSPNRDAWVNDLNQARKTRAQVLREIVESRETVDRHFNAAFVTMQYFGYLKRDPEPAGFNAWLAHLNANPQDFRTMIRGFVRSREYRNRFGPP